MTAIVSFKRFTVHQGINVPAASADALMWLVQNDRVRQRPRGVAVVAHDFSPDAEPQTQNHVGELEASVSETFLMRTMAGLAANSGHCF